MKRRTLITFATMTALGTMASAYAQAPYPERPITLIVPSAPGGTTDFTARLISDQLGKALGQPVVVDNKPGAAGNIGNQLVARAKPDGHTLLLAYSGYQVGNPHLFKTAGWDPIKDFTAVAMVTRAPQVIVASKSVPANNLQELIAYARANPKKVNFASSGNGSIQHIAGELLQQVTNTEMTHIAYRGAGPAVTDLLSGTVDLFITTPASVVSHIKAGKLKAFAVTGESRVPSLSNVPTASEAGLNNFKLDSWFAVYAPSGTSDLIVQRLNREIGKILAMPEVQKRAEDSGTTVETMTPAQLNAYTRKELDFWGNVIRSAKITLD
jgi:tripartite-type tricarboxylate transporter receptor subunit TctC